LENDEFKELNMFGERFEQKDDNKKESDKNYSKENEYKLNKHHIIRFLFRVSKIIIKKSIRLIRSIFGRIVIIAFKKISTILKKKVTDLELKNKKDIGYKITEVKKVKRNKVIIIRKRVPISINHICKNRTSKPCIYYYSLNSNKKEINLQEINKYSNLKESVWDFPIKKI